MHAKERKNPMKNFMHEFKAFALRGNMMDMAVGVIIGSAFSNIVTSLTDNLIQPILNFLTGSKQYTLHEVTGLISAFLSSLCNFLIMAFILFCLLKLINSLMTFGTKKETDETDEKECTYCKSKIHIDATRCPNCTSILETAEEQTD